MRRGPEAHGEVEIRFPPRRPWPADFPDVVVHTTVPIRDGHASYGAAKSGNAEAALALAVDLISDSSVEAIRTLAGGSGCRLLPVIADEAMGFNAIPDAMAQVIGRALGLPVVAGNVVQINRVGHTRAPAFQRLVTPAAFDGAVERDANYILVDDHVGLGGTLANLRGHVETHGGSVIAITTLTESRDTRRISIRPETLAMLRRQHGEELEILWRTGFGHGLDCLTEVEAQILCRQQSTAAIQDFLAKATVEARGRGLQAAVGSTG